MKCTKKEIDNYILENKNCIGFKNYDCLACYYYNNERCGLMNIRITYKNCETIKCIDCDWKRKKTTDIETCNYFYLEEIKKIEIFKKILK